MLEGQSLVVATEYGSHKSKYFLDGPLQKRFALVFCVSICIRIEDPDINPTDLQQRSPKHTVEKRASSINIAGKTGYPRVED
jgi:hypothetical protein